MELFSEKDKYDIDPDLYNKKYNKEKVFEAFEGGYSGPSSFYYIFKDGENFIAKYGYSQFGIKLFEDSPRLKIYPKTNSEYQNLLLTIRPMVSKWNDNYNNNDIMDGTQWHIDFIELNKRFCGSNEFPSNYKEVMDKINDFFNVKDDTSKYDINPEDNVPQFVYGPPNFKKEQPKPNYDDMSIRFRLDNGNKRFVMLFKNEKYSSSIMFVDQDKLNETAIVDAEALISKKEYELFCDKLAEIIQDWDEKYEGDKNLNWEIRLTQNKETDTISGNGAVPSNWNKLIDLLSEYEIIFKKKKKLDKENKQIKNDAMKTFDEIVKEDNVDPFWADIIINYFRNELKENDEVSKIIYRDLTKYNDIFNEFTKYLIKKTYDLPDAISVEGYTAKKIHELNSNFTAPGVYTFLKFLKEKPEEAKAVIKKGFPNKDVIPPTTINNTSKSNAKENIISNDELVKASLYGFLIGDALGVPVEFMSRESLKNKMITDMEEYGTHNQPKGTWSDDSSMVLATIDGLINSSQEIDYQLIMNNFLAWKQKGEFTPFNHVFDIGISTSTALDTYQQNKNNNHPEEIMCGTGEISSNGNGSLMRILPISLYLYYTGISYKDNKFIKIIKTISSMTHSHVYSVVGCLIYSIYICELLNEHDKFKAYKNTQTILQEICQEHPQLNIIKKIYGRIVYDDISKLKESDIKSSGYVVDSLEASMWSVLTTNTFEKAVLKAVNLGEDTDTIGALTGGLAGIIYGYKSISQKWINDLQRRDYLEQIINSFIKYLNTLSHSTNTERHDKINKNLDIKILQDTIDDLKNNPNACTLDGMTSINETFTIAESNPSAQLSKFISYLYDNNILNQNYLNDYKLIKDKEEKNLSLEEVITKLTFIIRSDRFCSGLLKSKVADGTMLRLVERLYNLSVPQNTNTTQIASDMARIMNYRLHAEQLFIPVLNDFQIENDNNPQTVLLASGHGYTEQLVSDGHIEDGEFDKRIDLVIANTKQFMKNNKMENVDNSFIPYKDYNNGVFDFKLYVQDMIISIQGEKKVIRNFLAFFVEPKMHDFYQLSLGAGPFVIPTEQLKTGIIDLENDQVTMSLNHLMKILLDNLKYKN